MAILKCIIILFKFCSPNDVTVFHLFKSELTEFIIILVDNIILAHSLVNELVIKFASLHLSLMN